MNATTKIIVIVLAALAVVAYAVTVGLVFGIEWAFLLVGIVCTSLLVWVVATYSRGHSNADRQ